METKGRIKINLSRLLGDIRMSQKELAIKTDIRPGTISNLYNEKSKEINFESLVAICEVLNCSISDLLEIVPKEEK